MKYRLKTLTGAGLRRGALAAGSILLCGVLSGSASAANDTLNLTFTYTVVEGTCTVDVPATVDFQKVAEKGETRDALDAAWFFIGSREYDINLTNCAGSGTTGSNIPSIIVSGFSAATGSANQKKFLMMPTTVANPSTGLGVVIGKTLTAGNTSTLSEIQGGKMYIDVGAANAIPAPTETIPLQIALACGEKSDCTSVKLNPGTESMTLVFSFGYH